MSAVGWLHAGSMLKAEPCSIATCWNRQVDCSSRTLGIQSIVQVNELYRVRCVRSHAASSGTTAQPATAQQLQPVPPVQQQQLVNAFSQQGRHGQDWGQQQGSVPAVGDQQRRQQLEVDSAAINKPELVTAAISRARSIAQLQVLLDTHGHQLNHIHVSAVFVQLQRLWTSSTASSSSSGSDCDGTSTPAGNSRGRDSSSNGGMQSSSTSRPVSPRVTLLQLQQLAQGLQRVDGRYCANVLYSTAVLEQHEPAAYCAPLIDQVCAASFDLVNLMPPQELATLVWSFALLDIMPAPHLLRRLLSNILRKLPGFGPQDLIMTLSGLPRLSPTGAVAPYATVHKLAAAAGRQLAGASPLETALLLSVLAEVHYQPSPAWLSSFWAVSEAKLPAMGPVELGMAGWALGKLSPVANPPPASWLQSWQEALAAACMHSQQQQREDSQQSEQTHVASSSRSSCRSRCSRPSLVELVMGVYGWSKVAPRQPPSPAFQQLLYSITQEAMTSDSSSSSLTVQQRQQQQPFQQQRLGSAQQLRGEQHSSLRSIVWQQSQRQLVGQQSCGISARLLVELLAAAARWQQLPPRSWLLEALSQLQRQLAAGNCSSRDISNLLWALATLGIKPNHEWMHHCTTALQQQLQPHKQQQQRQELHQGSSSRQQQQQPLGTLQPDEMRLQPRQLAVAVWSITQLGYAPSSRDFWDDFWSASQPLLAPSFTVSDIAVVLGAAVKQKQQPADTWLQTALAAAVRKAAGAATALVPAPAAGAAAARSAVGSVDERKRAKKEQGQQRHRQALRHAAAAGAVAGAVSNADSVAVDLVRLATAAARLGAVPGHHWCCQLLHALHPAASQLDQQAVCRLLWCLGKLGYRPAGGGLTGWLAARLAGPAAAVAAPLASYSAGQLCLLLSGLRACGVVLGGPWMQQLLQHTQATAHRMPLEVLVQVVQYVAAARIRPPSSWITAVTQALEALLAEQQQQRNVIALVASLVQLRVAPSAQLQLQLQLHCAAFQPQLNAAEAEVQAKWLHKLQQLQQQQQVEAAASQQQQHPNTAAMQQQQQQQGVLQQSSATAGADSPLARGQRQPHSQRGVNGVNGASTGATAANQSNGYHHSSSNSIVGSSSNGWTGAVWIASNTIGNSNNSGDSGA